MLGKDINVQFSFSYVHNEKEKEKVFFFFLLCFFFVGETLLNFSLVSHWEIAKFEGLEMKWAPQLEYWMNENCCEFRKNREKVERQRILKVENTLISFVHFSRSSDVDFRCFVPLAQVLINHKKTVWTMTTILSWKYSHGVRSFPALEKC